MSTALEVEPVLDEKVWRAWLLKGKLSEEASLRKAKVACGMFFILFSIGAAMYLMASKVG